MGEQIKVLSVDIGGFVDGAGNVLKSEKATLPPKYDLALIAKALTERYCKE